MVKRSGWPVHIAALLLGVSLAVMSHSKGTTLTRAADASCAPGASCMACVPNNCGQLTGSQFLVDAPDESGERCVEYDGVPPPHCATVSIDNKVIWDMDPYELVGDCQIINCASGAPTEETCTHPWVKPSDTDAELAGARP